MPAYTFSGVSPFIKRELDAKRLSHEYYNRLEKLWHVAAIQTCLGQLPTAGGPARASAYAYALRLRNELQASLAGIDEAIGEVAIACDLPLPDFLAKPKR